jgi:hypothetical protein
VKPGSMVVKLPGTHAMTPRGRPHSGMLRGLSFAIDRMASRSPLGRHRR